MPVIKGLRPYVPVLEPQRREQLLDQLVAERSGERRTPGLVIFEIPLAQSDFMDVLVVWQEFAELNSEERTGLILEAYGDKKDSISQALGVTYQEAVEQALLPYSVQYLDGDKDLDKVKAAMLDEGGFEVNGRVELRLPTREMAIASLSRLNEKAPGVKWGACAWTY